MPLRVGDYHYTNVYPMNLRDNPCRVFIPRILLLAFCGASAFSAQAATQSSVTRSGITWTFDGNYEVGQFVTGDWWVVGPVTITSVSPFPTGTRNGSTVNPGPYGQGYDSRGKSYTTSDNVSFPVTLYPDDSLVSSVSKPEGAAVQNLGPLQKQAVLTVVASAPASGTFRPSYAGTYKRYFNVSEIDWSSLPSETPPASTPAASSIVPFLSMPRIDHVNNWGIQFSCAEDNWANNNGYPCYGRDYSELISIAAMYVMLNTAQQTQVANGLIQLGIDNYGVLKAGGAWHSDGGHNSGRKFPIVFAGVMLNDVDMLAVGLDYAGAFGEDGQTYYSSATGQALWGRYCPSSQTGYFENGCSGSGAKDCRDPAELVDACPDYRTHNTSQSWVGQMLATLMIGGKPFWNHDAYFDYVDRWMDETGSVNHNLIEDMWLIYRDMLPSGSTGQGNHISEDFSAGASDFTVVSGGSWGVSGGRYVLSNPAGSTTPGILGNISVHALSVPGDFSLSAVMRITGTASAWDDAAIVFGYQDASNHYYVSLNESNDNRTKGILKVVNGVPTELADITIPVSANTDHLVEIIRSGSAISVAVNGASVASATDSTFGSGKVGFGSYNDGATFDDLEVSVETSGSISVVEIEAHSNDQEIWEDGGGKWAGQSTMRIGGANTVDSNGVFPFALPPLASGEAVVGATFEIKLDSITNSPSGGLDLYGLPSRGTSPVNASGDFYKGAFNGDSSATGIASAFATASTPANSVLVHASAALVNYINAQYTAGAGAGDFVFLRLSPSDPNIGNYQYWTFSTANASSAANRPVLILEIAQ